MTAKSSGVLKLYMQERKLRQAKQKQKMQQAMSSGQRIVIDLDFNSQMTSDQVKSQ